MPPRSKAQITRALDSLSPPDALEANQIIARVDKSLGHSRYSCQLPNKSLVVVELDERFRQTGWVERGNYVLLERYAASQVEDEAVGKIINIAKDEKAWRKMPYWYVGGQMRYAPIAPRPMTRLAYYYALRA